MSPCIIRDFSVPLEQWTHTRWRVVLVGHTRWRVVLVGHTRWRVVLVGHTRWRVVLVGPTGWRVVLVGLLEPATTGKKLRGGDLFWDA